MPYSLQRFRKMLTLPFARFGLHSARRKRKKEANHFRKRAGGEYEDFVAAIPCLVSLRPVRAHMGDGRHVYRRCRLS